MKIVIIIIIIIIFLFLFLFLLLFSMATLMNINESIFLKAIVKDTQEPKNSFS
jgi:hypothetical protein